MPELSLQALRGLLPQMSGAAFGTTSPQEAADMPPNVLDRGLRHALPFEAQPQAPRDDTVLYQTKAGPITRGDLERAMEAGMGVSGGGLSTKGIKAYHSSPHDFDRFDLRKIGTGEGNTTYGHGLYFAENPKVSGQGGSYWDQFRERFEGTPQGDAAKRLRDAGFDRERAADELAGYIEKTRVNIAERYKSKEDASSFFSAQNQLEKLLAQERMLRSGQPVGPRTYEVEIGADPKAFLDWYKPMREQTGIMNRVLDQYPSRDAMAKAVRRNEELAAAAAEPNASDAVKEAFWQSHRNPETKLGYVLERVDAPKGRYGYDPGANLNGARFYEALADTKAASSEALARSDVPGIRYFDAGSRGGDPAAQTYNYVVTNPNTTIDIMKKYGIAGMAAPALGYGAMRGDE